MSMSGFVHRKRFSFMTLVLVTVTSFTAAYWTLIERVGVNNNRSKKSYENVDMIHLDISQIPQQSDTAPHSKTVLEGFSSEKGLYNFTVVTALIDIGRGQWSFQKRTYEEYLQYLKQVLMLDVNMVVFIEEKGRQFVENMRRGRETHTRIIVTTLKDLPYYRYRDRIAEIMNSTEYKESNALVEKKLCEGIIPEYDIITLSKLYFMNRTVLKNPFSTSYFIWIDGGYAHGGKNVFPKDNIWIPKNLFEYPDKITFIEMWVGVEAFRDKMDKIHKMDVAVVVGGFFAGGGEVFKEACVLQSLIMEEWMKRGIIDDDQTMIMAIYFRKPSLFRFIRGGWNDAFKFFNVH